MVAFQVSAPARESTVLYDGHLGGTLGDQGFDFLAFGIQADHTFNNGITTLDTMPTRSDQAGYFIGKSITLDRSTGYDVLFTMQIKDELHDNHHRAGFSIIILSDDLLGLELGFWSNEIWAQEGGIDNLFTHAEGAAYNTTADLITYRLSISEDVYTLMANDTQILSGPLRDYTAFSETIDPYETPNLLFIGDNTTRAQTRVDIAYVAIETDLLATNTAVPTATNAATRTLTPTVTAATVPSTTPTPFPSSSLRPKWVDFWWQQCTSGYPPK